MSIIKFKDLKTTIEKMMPRTPFPEIEFKSQDHPGFSEKNIKTRLEKELNKVTNPENQ